VFTQGSSLGGLVQGEVWLIIARIIQGSGGAIVAPTALSILTGNFPDGLARNRSGAYGAALTIGAAIFAAFSDFVLTKYFGI
jgi:MFS family permease